MNWSSCPSAANAGAKSERLRRGVLLNFSEEQAAHTGILAYVARTNDRPGRLAARCRGIGREAFDRGNARIIRRTTASLASISISSVVCPPLISCCGDAAPCATFQSQRVPQRAVFDRL